MTRPRPVDIKEAEAAASRTIADCMARARAHVIEDMLDVLREQEEKPAGSFWILSGEGDNNLKRVEDFVRSFL